MVSVGTMVVRENPSLRLILSLFVSLHFPSFLSLFLFFSLSLKPNPGTLRTIYFAIIGLDVNIWPTAVVATGKWGLSSWYQRKFSNIYETNRGRVLNIFHRTDNYKITIEWCQWVFRFRFHECCKMFYFEKKSFVKKKILRCMFDHWRVKLNHMYKLKSS